MDDHLERDAALQCLSYHNEELLRSCKGDVDMLDVFEELEIITEEEKDNNDSGKKKDVSPLLPILFCFGFIPVSHSGFYLRPIIICKYKFQRLLQFIDSGVVV